MLDNFINHLPEKVRSTDDFDYGTKFRKKSNALKRRYVEVNQLYKKYIALDLDEPGSAYWWEEKNLPPPTIVIVNPRNARCHYLYELKTPVYYTEEARRAPQKFYESIDSALTTVLKADLGYVGLFVKNPLHESWRVIKHNAIYDLEDFNEYIDLQYYKNKQKYEASLEGRNTTLFHNLRHWAYKEVKQHGSYITFQSAVDDQALSINKMFLAYSNGVLAAKEALSVAKSVGKWTWKHRYTIGNGTKNRGVLANQIDETMDLHARQSLGAKYSHTVRTEKVDDKIKLAIHKCKERGLVVNPGNLEKCGLADSTYRKYKEATHNWIRILA
ncbi:replication initiation protein [Undibacterium danionis]|uniref:Replication initiation protein n=1 Tax=Undibacterium danionis TaxID=1812100 RepID=A0ABV6ID32_9BURK